MLGRALAAMPLVALSSIALASAAASGRLDPTFSGDGWVRSYDQTGYTRGYFPRGAEDIALQPDGKILATGEIQDGGSEHYFGVYRWTSTGELDASFGEGGWAVTKVGEVAFPRAVAVQRDGKIIVAGEADCRSIWCITLIRLTAGGALDPTFGKGGVVVTGGRHCSCGAYDVEVLRNGRILVVGGGLARGHSVFLVARYLPSGALDRKFGHQGWAWARFPGPGSASAADLQSNGKIVLAGTAEGSWSTRGNFALARLLPNGRPDRSFSGDGHRIVTFWSMREGGASDVDIQRDGRIVAVGSTAVGQPSARRRISVIRLKRNGSLDRSFAGRGRTLLKPADHGGWGYGIRAQADGRLLVAGMGHDEDNFFLSASWVLARYLPNGRLDRSFGQRGLVIGDFGTGNDWAKAIELQRDGRIVVGGEVYRDQAIARFR